MTDISGVVDWEHFTPAAPPFEDLFHFTLSYALDYPWAAFSREAPEDAFQRGFLSDTGVSRAIRAALVGYCDLTGLAFPALRPLFHLFLLRRTLRDRRSKPEHWSSLHLPLARSRSTVFEI